MTHWRALTETWRSLTHSKAVRFAALLVVNLLILGVLLLPTATNTTAISFNRLNPDVVELASTPLINNIFGLFAPQAGSDVCDASTTRIVGAFPYNDSGTTVGMTDNYDLPPDVTDPTCTAPTNGTGGGSAPRGVIYTGTGTGPDAAYVVTTDQACTLQINMDPTSTQDLALIVYQGVCSNSLGDCVVVDDTGTGGALESVTIDALAGVDYYIVIDGYSTGGTPPGPSGPYTINVTETTATGCVGVVGGGGGPAITLAKTVGTDPSVCAATDEITVPYGTNVTYCYTVQNTGTVTFTNHTLTDTVLGTLLNNFPYNLAPSASTFLTVSANLTQTTVNTATWAATDGVTMAVGIDSATVNVTVEPDIAVNPVGLSSVQAPSTAVTLTLTISNTGNPGSTLNWSLLEGSLQTVAQAGGARATRVSVGAGGQFVKGLTALSQRGGILAAPRAPQVVLYDQTDNAAGNGFPDQDFEPAFDVYDAEGADDFVVPGADGIWLIETIDTVGTTGSPGNATVDVTFYTNAAGGGDPDMPGTPVCSYAGVTPTADNAGSLTIDLPAPCALPSGTYWISIQTNQDFGTAGQHFWSNRSVQTGSEAVWRNPGDGFATGCLDWTPQTTCGVGGGASPDALFRLSGVAGGCTPTNLPWLTLTPMTGTTAVGSPSTVNATFDSTGYTAGVYTGTVCIVSNASSGGLLTVPVTMTVQNVLYLPLVRR